MATSSTSSSPAVPGTPGGPDGPGGPARYCLMSPPMSQGSSVLNNVTLDLLWKKCQDINSVLLCRYSAMYWPTSVDPESCPSLPGGPGGPGGP